MANTPIIDDAMIRSAFANREFAPYRGSGAARRLSDAATVLGAVERRFALSDLLGTTDSGAAAPPRMARGEAAEFVSRSADRRREAAGYARSRIDGALREIDTLGRALRRERTLARLARAFNPPDSGAMAKARAEADSALRSAACALADGARRALEYGHAERTALAGALEGAQGAQTMIALSSAALDKWGAMIDAQREATSADDRAAALARRIADARATLAAASAEEREALAGAAARDRLAAAIARTSDGDWSRRMIGRTSATRAIARAFGEGQERDSAVACIVGADAGGTLRSWASEGATVVLSADPTAHARLGHYACDSSACFGNGRHSSAAPAILADSGAIIYRIDDSTGRALARAWGWIAPDGAAWFNAYTGADRAAPDRAWALALARLGIGCGDPRNGRGVYGLDALVSTNGDCKVVGDGAEPDELPEPGDYDDAHNAAHAGEPCDNCGERIDGDPEGYIDGEPHCFGCFHERVR